MFSKLTLLSFISSAAAHGIVTGIVADGIYYDGYQPSMQYITPAPVTSGWKIPQDLGNGFISPSQFDTPDFICHVGATNAMAAAPVKGGGKVELQWTPWPTSHKGPVIDYLANCNGPCETVDKTTLKWFKIDAVGLLSTAVTDGSWATDELIANNNSWTVTIPSTIASGNYVLRHEILALHNANNANGAQDYPFCINLAITSSGTDNPAGTLGEDLYSSTDPGVNYSLYGTLPPYEIPGPALYSGAQSIAQTLPAKPTASASGVYTVAAGGAGSAPVTSSAAPAPSTTLKTSVVPPASKTSSATSSAVASATGTPVPKYQQCGGTGWQGSTVCVAGSTCTVQSSYYSQCI